MAAIAPLAVGIVLAVLSTAVQTDVSERRQYTCDGALPMPASGYAYAWLGLAAGALAACLALGMSLRAAARRRAQGAGPGSGPLPAVLAVSVVAVLFEAVVLYTAYRSATPIPSLCSG